MVGFNNFIEPDNENRTKEEKQHEIRINKRKNSTVVELEFSLNGITPLLDFRTDGAIASPGSENMEPAEPTKARRWNYSSVKEIQDKGAVKRKIEKIIQGSINVTEI